jgi:transcriptional regulator with XRE-family HTH domain
VTDSGHLYAALAYVIRRHRLVADKSMEQVYRQADLAKNVYLRLEANERPFSAVQILAIAQVYGLEAWQLMQEAETAMKAGDLPQLPANERAWKRALGFQP